MLKQLTEESVNEIAAIHRLAFPESAWTKLGGRVAEEYYLWHLLGPHPIVRATGVTVDGDLAGFCISGIFNASTSGFLSKNRDLLVMRLAIRPWLIFDPVFLEKLKSGRNILKRFKKKSAEARDKTPAVPSDSFGILAIAVDPRRQGLGLGQILMGDAEDAAVELKFPKMDLTVNPENHSAIKFYEKLNWTKLVKNGVWNGVMIKSLSPQEESPGKPFGCK